jgi:acetyl-CoA synthetase
LGTAEVESAITSHDDVAECAVVGVPHDVKGQAIFAYVILNEVLLSTHIHTYIQQQQQQQQQRQY